MLFRLLHRRTKPHVEVTIVTWSWSYNSCKKAENLSHLLLFSFYLNVLQVLDSLAFISGPRFEREIPHECFVFALKENLNARLANSGYTT